MPNDCKFVMSPSEMFGFFDEHVALLFVGFTVWDTNRDCAVVIEPVYRDTVPSRRNLTLNGTVPQDNPVVQSPLGFFHR